MPWKIIVTKEEKNRFEAEEWIRERLKKHNQSIEKISDSHYALPLVERNRRLECLFLDEDGLCSQFKHHGYEFWSTTCKTFPYEFIELEGGEISVSLSHHCPSIRDNYGQPLEGQVARYAELSGTPFKLSSSMLLGIKTRLTQKQYLAISARWIEILSSTLPLSKALLLLYDFLDELAVVFMEKETVTDQELMLEMDKLRALEPKPENNSTRFLPELLLSLTLRPFTYPLRLFEKFQFSFNRFFKIYQNTFRLLRHRGMIDLILFPRPFNLSQVDFQSSILQNEAMEKRLRSYFIEILRRRNLFLLERNLNQVLLDLAMSFTLVLRVTRYHAAAFGNKPSLSDLKEGISFSECLLVYHQSKQAKAPILVFIMELLAGNRRSYVGLLSVEK